MTAESPGAEIRRRRKNLGLSQAELGQRIGRSRMAVVRYEMDPSSPHHLPPPTAVLMAVRSLRGKKKGPARDPR